MDVVSAGEVAIAKAGGADPTNLYFHGNNKTPEELDYALDEGVGRFVIDSFHELDLLNDKARARGVNQDVLLRLSPSVDPHTHVMTTTGILDSKFGFSIETGDAATAIRQALDGVQPQPDRYPLPPGVTDLRAWSRTPSPWTRS